MKLFVRAVAALFIVGALASRSYSGAPEISDWDVAGIHNKEGAYSGTARLTLDQLTVQLTLTATTNSGKTLAWSAHGKLDAGALVLTIDGSPRKAEYVLGDDGTLSGYWQGTKKTGGTETLTQKSGNPLLTSGGSAAPHLPADALAVPLVTQPDEYGCGAASLQAILYYYRVSDGDLHTLYKPLGTSAQNGTEPPGIVAFARQKGLTASYVEGATQGDLKNALWNHDPVMLVIQAWKETTTAWVDDVDDAHWVVLVGMDASYAYFMDPWAHFGSGYMPISELLDRWHCAEDDGKGGVRRSEHEAIFFHGLAPPRGTGLVRMQ